MSDSGTISAPCLLLDTQIACANLDRMLAKAKRCGVTLKPHFKTHQSIDIAKWFRERGVRSITVSSVKMAEYFAGAGWNDITIAFPCNVLAADRINCLAGEITLSILASDRETVRLLAPTLKNTLQVYIEIDTGAHRTGLRPEETEAIEKLLCVIQENPTLHFKGFYSHPGHSYRARSRQEILAIHRQACKNMQSLKDRFSSASSNLVCCIGDTPCCSVADDFEGIDEISPGNFIFYDVMQAQIGSCSPSNIAVALACPVVGKYPGRDEIVVHGGAVHLSKEQLREKEVTHYGKIVRLRDDLSWGKPLQECYVKSLSQEHGIVHCSKAYINQIHIGDIISILPVHSCLTADTMHGYMALGSSTALNHIQSTRATY